LKKNFLQITCKKEKLEKRIKLEKNLLRDFGDRLKKKVKRGGQKGLLFSLVPSSPCNRDIIFIHFHLKAKNDVNDTACKNTTLSKVTLV